MPNYFKKDWLQDWKRERQMGRTKWALVHSVAFLVIATLIDAFVNDRNVWEMEPQKMALALFFYAAGGLIYGLFTWWFNERKLEKEG
jgi:hypothetical protein